MDTTVGVKPTLKERQRRVRDEAILGAARELLARRGYGGDGHERFSCPCGHFQGHAIPTLRLKKT